MYTKDELDIIEHLLEQIEPLLLNDIYKPTSILATPLQSGGRRYDAAYGKYRLVIVDAEFVGDDVKHEVALTIRKDQLNFIPFRDKSADAAFKQYKTTAVKTLSPANAGLFASSTANVQAGGSVFKNKKSGLQASFWNNDKQLSYTLLEDPEHGFPIGHNSKTGKSASGNTVRLIQEALFLLNRADIETSELYNHIFGTTTAQAVKDYQTKKGLVADGVVGSKTIAALDVDMADIESTATKWREFTQATYNKQEQDKKAAAEKDKQLKGISYNKSKHVVLNLPELDTSYLEQMGIDSSKLEFKYLERDEFFESLPMGGCRYNTYYNGMYMGVIDVQVKLNIEDGRNNNTAFVDMYNGKLPWLWAKAYSGELFRISYSTGIGGDPDFISALGMHGFKNHFGVAGSFEDMAVMGLSEPVSHAGGLENMSTRGNTRMGTGVSEPEVVKGFNDWVDENGTSTGIENKGKIEGNTISEMGYAISVVSVEYNGKQVPVYRGGNSFELKSYDFKIDKKTGFVETNKGLSLDVNPESIKTKFGSAYQIESLPEGLKIIQRGDRIEHFEIVPIGKMTPEQFQSLLNQIKISLYNK